MNIFTTIEIKNGEIANWEDTTNFQYSEDLYSINYPYDEIEVVTISKFIKNWKEDYPYEGLINLGT